MTVGDIMTTEVVTVGPDRSLASIQTLFDEKSLPLVVVVSPEEEVIGMITRRDILQVVSPFVKSISERGRDARTLDRRAHQIMTRRPMSCREDDDVADVAQRLVDLDAPSFLVMSENNDLVGYVTRTDFIRYFLATR